MSMPPTSVGIPGMSLAIKPSNTASLGDLPLQSSPALAATPAPELVPQPTPAPATKVRTSFVLSSSRSHYLSPETMARHALGSPVVSICGPPRLAEGWLSFPVTVPSPADDPRVVCADATPDAHRSPSLPGSDPTSKSQSAYESSYVAHGNGAGPGPSTAAAWRGAGRLNMDQDGSTHRSFSPSRVVAATAATVDTASVSALVMTRSTSGASNANTELSGGASAISASSSSATSGRRPWVPQRTHDTSVNISINIADFKTWSVRSEDFGQSRKEARRARGDRRDASSSTAGHGSAGPRPEAVREREDADKFGRGLGELKSIASDMSEKLAALHFVGREPLEGEGEGLIDQGRERGDVRREKRRARRAAVNVPTIGEVELVC